MKEIYTGEQWAQDQTFGAEPGQEITEEIYNNMLNCMPPKDLPNGKARQALQDYNIPVHAGFLMGEPHSCNNDGEQLYLAFGCNDYGKGKHYYYLGLSIEAPKLRGSYYYFDCLNAFISGRFWKLSAFENEAEAISKAADYEAELYKITFDENGEQNSKERLYNPWACFDE